MRIKGKIAVWFWVMFAGVEIQLLYGLFAPSEEDGDIGLQAILVFVFLVWNIVILPMAVRNYVEIVDERLIVVLGFCKTAVEIGEITEVYKTHNPLASGALSLDRVMIKGRKQALLISVCDKELMFRELKRINPAIRIGRRG